MMSAASAECANTTIDASARRVALMALLPCRLLSRPDDARRAVQGRGTHEDQGSYLNDSCSRARYATTLPPSILTSSFDTSAIRRSRNDELAVETALFAASSHDFVLTPMTSITRYTPSSPPPLAA